MKVGAYCHNLQNLADDSKYTKVVARKMLQMTQHINAEWKPHVAGTGVTCYTPAHRGNNIPQNVWFKSPEQKQAAALVGDDAFQNKAATSVALASLPYDPFTPYLSQAQEIRVNGPTALPTGNRQSVKQGEFTYGLMMHMSQSLGVNCTYCHNSRAFANWEESTPQRHDCVVRHPHGSRHQQRLHGAADFDLPGAPQRPDRRCGEGELRDMSPGRLQAAVRREHAQGLPRARGAGRGGLGAGCGVGDFHAGRRHGVLRGRFFGVAAGCAGRAADLDRSAEGQPGGEGCHLRLPFSGGAT